jgi:glycogen(starch) synthase
VRVAFLTTAYRTEKPFAGGLATYLGRVVSALARTGHEPEVFTLASSDGTSYDGPVPVHRVRDPFECGRAGKIAGASGLAGLTQVFLQGAALERAFRRRHATASFEVVQAASAEGIGLLPALRQRVPVVTRVSGYRRLMNEAARAKESAARRQIERAQVWQFRRSAAVYAPSHLLAGLLREHERVEARVIEPPFELQAPEGPEPGEERCGLFFGSVGYLKGCDRLAAVLPELMERDPDFRFRFVGPTRRREDGTPFTDWLRERLAPYGRRVQVLGKKTQPELFPIVRAARFVALPSRFDNLPNACMEAMALGRVVIGTHEASFDQLIRHGESGFLVSQTDDGELEATMRRAWEMPAMERAQMGRRAAETLERMRPEQAVPELIGFFEEVLANRSGTGR